MKNKTVTVIIVVLAIVLGYAIGGTVVALFTKKPAETQETSALKSGFMEGCNENGKQTAYCECSYDLLMERYGVKEVVKMGNEYSDTGVISDEMMSVATDCIDKYVAE